IPRPACPSRWPNTRSAKAQTGSKSCNSTKVSHRLAHEKKLVHNLVSSPTALCKTGNDGRKSPKFAGFVLEKRGYSSAGRALAWHARGQRFDPAYLHQSKAK